MRRASKRCSWAGNRGGIVDLAADEKIYLYHFGISDAGLGGRGDHSSGAPDDAFSAGGRVLLSPELEEAVWVAAPAQDSGALYRQLSEVQGDTTEDEDQRIGAAVVFVDRFYGRPFHLEGGFVPGCGRGRRLGPSVIPADDQRGGDGVNQGLVIKDFSFQYLDLIPCSAMDFLLLLEYNYMRNL